MRPRRRRHARWSRRWFGVWVWLWRRQPVRLFVGFGGFGLDQQQGVVEDDIAAAKLKSLELAAALSISRAKEIPAGGAAAYGLRQHIAVPETR